MSTESRSLWADVATPSGHAKLAASYDVCVVGAGIAGLTTAYHLLNEGLTVAIFESQPQVAHGESLSTTAHLASIIDDRFHRLVSIRGAENARLAHQSHATAIDTIDRICQEEGIDCDFQRVDGYLFVGDQNDPDALNKEEDAVRELGIPYERFTNVQGIINRQCLKFPRQAQFHPTKYLAGLGKAVEALGGVIINDTRVTNVEGGDRLTVTTQDEHSISARHVVVATNAPINSGVILNSKLAAYNTYAIAAPLLRSNFPPGLYWDTLDPYHYVRMQTMKSTAGSTDYLIVGGEDHKTGQADDTKARWERLESWMRRVFVGVEIGNVNYHWSGEIFETLDGLALIGPQPGGPKNVFIVTGDSGMGLTHGTIAGMMLPHLILGRGHPWEELFDPRRMPLGAARTFVEENVNMVSQYRDWVTSGDATADQIQPGQGAIVRKGLKKLAVHCEENGTCHTLSAKCPHMGALVHWNEAEGTWDCPAHGSRFTATGKVLHGPAVNDLEHVEEAAAAAK